VDVDENADAEERGEGDNGYPPQVVHLWDLYYSSGLMLQPALTLALTGSTVEDLLNDVAHPE
jgi:hypothetical protein